MGGLTNGKFRLECGQSGLGAWDLARWHRWVRSIALSLLTLPLTVAIAGDRVRADITPAADGTGTIVTPHGDRFDIEGGQRSGDGANLFHSFEKFGLDTGQIANFLAQPEIRNILGRIVGGETSLINGLIQVTGSNANLFLMNPAGIIFGPNARLNVPASFTATTATGIGFSNGSFPVIGPPDWRSLVGHPTHLQMGDLAGAIVNLGSLTVPTDANLTLVGNTVLNTGTLQATGGQIAIAAIPGENFVRISQAGQLLSLDIPLAATPGLTPLDLPQVLTGGDTGGQVLQVSGQPGTALISGQITTAQPNGAGGQVNILGRQIQVTDATIDASGATTGGQIRIGGDRRGGGALPTAAETFVNEGSQLRADAYRQGAGGQVIVWADGNTDFRGQVSAQGGPIAGDGGFVEISGKTHLHFQAPPPDLSAPNGSPGTLLFDPENILIANGHGGADDAPIAAGRLSSPVPAGTLTIAETTLESLAGHANVVLEASNDITIADLADDRLSFAPGEGFISFTADADRSGVGRFTMLDTKDTIQAPGRNLRVQAATIQAGHFDTSDRRPNGSGGILVLKSSTGAIQAGNLTTAGTLDGGPIAIAAATDLTIGHLSTQGSTGTGGNVTLWASGQLQTGRISTQGKLGNGHLDRQRIQRRQGQEEGFGDFGNTTDPSTGDPFFDSSFTDPGFTDPDFTDPGFTDEPPTDEPPTDEPPTDEPPTDEPPTDEPPTDGESTNEEFPDDGTIADDQPPGDGPPEAEGGEGDAGSDNGEPDSPGDEFPDDPAEDGQTADDDATDGEVANGQTDDSGEVQTGDAEPETPEAVFEQATATAETNQIATDLEADMANTEIAIGEFQVDNFELSIDALDTDFDLDGSLGGEGEFGDFADSEFGEFGEFDGEFDGEFAGEFGGELAEGGVPGEGEFAGESEDSGAEDTGAEGMDDALAEEETTADVDDETTDSEEATDTEAEDSEDTDPAESGQGATLQAAVQSQSLAALRTNVGQQLDAGNIAGAAVSLDGAFSQEVGGYYGLEMPDTPVSVDRTQGQLRQVSTDIGTTPAIIYAFSRPDQLDLILVLPDGNPIYHSVPAATHQRLQATIADLRAELTDRNAIAYDDYLQPAQQLYQWLIAPLEADLRALGIGTLLFSLDSGLRSLPLASLHDGQQFLIEKYSITRIPSVNLVDTRHTNLQNAQVLAMGASEFTDQSPLPAVPTELATIVQDSQSALTSSQSGIWPGNAFLNQDFTLANLQAERQNGAFRIVHLATHAEFRPGTPDNSYIQLWDQRLRLSQLRELGFSDPPVDLLVLSACRTALGDPDAELGFAGLAVQAGVKSAMGSLWLVSDEGTLTLMQQFYEQLRRSPIKAEALRQAQLALLHGKVSIESGQIITPDGKVPLPPELAEVTNDNLSHPYFWSAFTLIGSPW